MSAYDTLEVFCDDMDDLFGGETLQRIQVHLGLPPLLWQVCPTTLRVLLIHLAEVSKDAEIPEKHRR